MRDGDALENNPAITRSALEAIHSQVFGWALSRCNHNRSDAEDLVQQTYVELLSGNARYNGESSLKTFVFAVVQNLARSRYRSAMRRLRLVREQAAVTEHSAAPAAPDDSSALWRIVGELPARQRDVIELVFCRELTIEEAAAIMGVSIGTARVHYDRAKKALRKRLAREDDDR